MAFGGILNFFGQNKTAAVATGAAATGAAAGGVIGYSLAKRKYLKTIEHWKELNDNLFLVAETDAQKRKEDAAIQRLKILKALAFKDGRVDEDEWSFLVMTIIDSVEISSHRKIFELSILAQPEKCKLDNVFFNNIESYFPDPTKKASFVRQLYALAEIDGDFSEEEKEFITKVEQALNIPKEEIGIDRIRKLIRGA